MSPANRCHTRILEAEIKAFNKQLKIEISRLRVEQTEVTVQLEGIPLQERIETVGDDADLQEGMTPSASCFTSPAPAHATCCW